MRTIKTKLNRLISILAAAHQAEADTAAPVSPRWRAGVMRSIRQIDPHAKSFSRSVDFAQLAWRLAPVALLLVVILSLYIVQTGSAINSQMVTLSISEPTTTYLAYIPF